MKGFLAGVILTIVAEAIMINTVKRGEDAS